MTPQQIISVLKQLPTSYPSDRTEQSAKTAIEMTAELIAPKLAENGLQLSKGSSSPSSTRTYARIYLERAGNTSHDSRHHAYAENVVNVWEWQVSSKYGSTPLTCKAICALCDELQSRFA
jgi:hypothetical protein